MFIVTCNDEPLMSTSGEPFRFYRRVDAERWVEKHKETLDFVVGQILRDHENKPLWIVADGGEKISPDGRLLSIAKYPKLFAMIGYTYTTKTDIPDHLKRFMQREKEFRLPDLRTAKTL